MKLAITYSTRTNNTKKLADVIHSVLKDNNIIYFGPIDDKALEADRIFLGFWTDHGICDEKTRNFIKKLDKQEVVLFGTAGLGSSNTYFDKIIQNTRKLFPEKAKFIASFMCQGKMPLQLKERYLELKKLPEEIPNLDKLIKNFDEALNHPSDNDLRSLGTWLRKMS